MAALLVAIAVLSVVMLVALPTWRQQAQREREAELIWRGEQYARAIDLYQRKLAGAFPPSLEVLVEQKYLRKLYKDPVSGEDFVPVYSNMLMALGQLQGDQTGQAPGQGALPPQIGFGETVAQQGPRQPTLEAGPGGVGSSPTPGGQTSGSPFGPTTGVTGVAGGAGQVPGIVGVMPKSTGNSIRLYNGRNRYDQWIFVYTAVSNRPGAIGVLGQTPPQTGAPGQVSAPTPQNPGGGQ